MKEPTDILILEKFTIQVYEESDYSFNLNTNENRYGYVHVDIEKKQPTALFGIEVLVSDKRFRSCLIGSSGAATVLSPATALFIHHTYTICCGDTVFAFSMPDLVLLWKTKADDHSCVEIVPYGKGYIVRGATGLTCIGEKGKILWRQIGADSFAAAEEKGQLSIVDDQIVVIKGQHNNYYFTANGARITEEAFQNRLAEPEAAIAPGKNRPWWKPWS